VEGIGLTLFEVMTEDFLEGAENQKENNQPRQSVFRLRSGPTNSEIYFKSFSSVFWGTVVAVSIIKYSHSVTYIVNEKSIVQQINMFILQE
jgi:hypothetical protein